MLNCLNIQKLLLGNYDFTFKSNSFNCFPLLLTNRMTDDLQICDKRKNGQGLCTYTYLRKWLEKEVYVSTIVAFYFAKNLHDSNQ